MKHFIFFVIVLFSCFQIKAQEGADPSILGSYIHPTTSIKPSLTPNQIIITRNTSGANRFIYKLIDFSLRNDSLFFTDDISVDLGGFNTTIGGFTNKSVLFAAPDGSITESPNLFTYDSNSNLLSGLATGKSWAMDGEDLYFYKGENNSVSSITMNFFRNGNDDLSIPANVSDFVPVAGRNWLANDGTNYISGMREIVFTEDDATKEMRYRLMSALNPADYIVEFSGKDKTQRLNQYGTGIKEASDLGKSPSGYMAAFATDGTIIETPFDPVLIENDYLNKVGCNINLETKLTRLKDGDNTHLNVLFIGDSNIHRAHRMTDPLKDALQAAGYNISSLGYTTLRSGVPPNGINLTRTSGWTNFDFTYPSIDGNGTQSNTVGDKLTLTTTAGSDNRHLFDAFDIHYITSPGNGDFRYRVDGGPWTTISTSAVLDSKIETVTGLSLAIHTIEIEVVTATVAVSGVNLKSNTPGINIHKAGNTGAEASEFDGMDPTGWSNSVSNLNTDVIFIMLGTNERTVGVPIEDYKTFYQSIITKIQNVTAADIILVAPTEDNQVAALPITDYIEKIYELADINSLAVASLYSLHKDFVTSDGLGNYEDDVHFSIQGGQVNANHLVNVFFEDVEGVGGGGGSSLTADNGLTVQSDVVKLGGTLIENTTIDHNNFNLTFFGNTKVGTLGGVTSQFNVNDLFLADDKVRINTADNEKILNIEGGINLTDPNDNIIIGKQSSLSLTSGFRNTAIGKQTLQFNTTGAANTAIGFQAMQSHTTGSSNMALGSLTLTNSTTGDANVAIGPSTMEMNTTGSFNVGIGGSALRDNITGENNVAIGRTALGDADSDFNLAIGNSALRDLLTGVRNVAVGYQSGQNSLDSDNIFIGYRAGRGLNNGNNNILIGHRLNDANGGNTLDNTIIIGDNQDIYEDDLIRLGNNNSIRFETTASLINLPIPPTLPIAITDNTTLPTAKIGDMFFNNVTNEIWIKVSNTGIVWITK